MRKSLAIVRLLGSGAIVLGALSHPAHADSFSMAAGMQSNPGPACFQFGFLTPGVNKIESTACFGNQWVMPLYWRNFFSASTNRTVSVRGQVSDSNSLLGCTLYVFNSSGAIASQNNATFPMTGSSYTSINLTVNNVTSSSTSVVVCTAIGSETRLLKVDYSP